jgi:hypothetical protein
MQIETPSKALSFHTSLTDCSLLVLTFQSLAVSLRTARFNIQKLYMVLALCCVFCVDLRTDSGFGLYSIDWLVFITEMKSVYSAVRTDCLYKADL